MSAFFERYLSQFDMLAPIAAELAVVLACLAILLLAGFAYWLARRVIVQAIRRVLHRTQSKRDDILKKNRVFERLSHLAPGIVINELGPEALAAYPALANAISVFSLVYLAVVVITFVNALIDATLEIYNTYDFANEFPITSLVQVFKIIMTVIGVIMIVSLLLDESPLTLFTALGALAAGATFVFKDAILGFVAGIQLTANRMVAVGDWIEMPKYGVDGDVMEIALTTVKIRNFDKTITTIPTYSLISDSFKNWRGMKETGGRRIKRSIFVDISSIRFCDEEMLSRFRKVDLLKDYLAEKQSELSVFNADRITDESPTTDGRRLTNIGTFRAYLLAYLKSHPKVSQTLTLLVRQLRPTAEGLPIELYFFTNETRWAVYEEIQADIFDHIFAAAHEFEIRVFQNPTGSDFQDLGTS